MSRSKAFGIHLAMTLAALLAVFAVTRLIWYPTPLLAADGAWQTLGLVAGVSLVIGPVLTLIVFRAGKKGLRFDLGLIILIQTAALAFGIHLLYIRRIQMVVYSQGSFYGLDAHRLARVGHRGLALLQASHTHPTYVFVHLPASKKAMLGVEIRTLHGEPPIFLRGWRYRPYTTKEQQVVLAHGLPLAAIAQTNARAAQALAHFRSDHPHISHYCFVPYHGTYTTVILALRRSNGQVGDVLPFNPGALGKF